MTSSIDNAKRENIVVTRVFDAPVALVWKAWTDPEQIMRWWGPDYFTSPSCEIDFREGGTSIVCMRSPEGQDMYSIWSYTKIVPMQQIDYVHNLSDKEGNRIDPAEIGMPPDFPEDMRTVVDFKDLGDKTELTVTEYDWTRGQMYEFSVLGLNQTLDKLGESLKSA